MLPLFKKSHIHSRHIEDFLKTGFIRSYPDDANKRNALRQASSMFRIVDNELFRHGTEREYEKYGLRLVVHDDQPEKKAEIIGKCHIDNVGNHLGMNNTIKNVTEIYYWQGISAHVKMYLKQCDQCKVRSKLSAEEWLKTERLSIDRKKEQSLVSAAAMKELKILGRVKKPSPPETFFIVNAEKKVDLDSNGQPLSMTVDSNNIEYVVETLGQSDGVDLEEVCHVLNVPDIVPTPERFRSREIETYLKEGCFPDDFTPNMKNAMKGPASQYCIVEGELYHEANKSGRALRQVIHDDLPALKVKVMVEAHIDEDGSHCGLNKTIGKLNEKYYWMGMSLDVRKFMLHCKICAESRGKRKVMDRKTYDEEAMEVRNRHLKKMSEASANELVALPLMDETGENSADGMEDGHQVIRLIGPNKEVTEITVAIVNQETVKTEGNETEQNVNKTKEYVTVGSMGAHSKSLITKEMTDAVAQIEAAEAAMEIDVSQTEMQKTDIAVQEDPAHADLEEEIQPMVIRKQEETVSENRNLVAEAVDVEIEAHDAITVNDKEANNMVVEQIKSEENKNVLIIREQEDGITDTVQGENSIGKHVDVAHMESKAGLYSYYKGFIYVPSIKKTRIIENFMKRGEKAPGFSYDKLLDMSTSFEVVDGVLYKRPSRYKGRLIVVHDDDPELKLKLIEEHHLKRNGSHCTDLVTAQNVGFKYFWEELKWDVIRWYPSCTTCVQNGVERRTSKKILSVAQRKKFLAEKKTIDRMIPPSAKGLRSGNKVRLEKIEDWEKIMNRSGGQFVHVYQQEPQPVKSICIQVAEKEDSLDQEDNASEAEEELHSGSSNGEEENEYDLMVFSTLDQEETIREMYEQQGWDYDASALSKVLIEESLEENQNHFLITLRVTEVQEQAIKELFETLGIDIDDSLAREVTSEDLAEFDKTQKEVSDKSAEVPEPVTTGRVPAVVVQDAGMKDVKEDPANMCRKPENIQPIASPKVVPLSHPTEKGTTSPKKVIVNVQPVANQQKNTASSQQKIVQSNSNIVQQDTVRKTTQSSPGAVHVGSSQQNKSSTLKRPLEESISAQTTGSEGCRPRREIKKPRRFSPDSSPVKSPSVVIKVDIGEISDTQLEEKVSEGEVKHSVGESSAGTHKQITDSHKKGILEVDKRIRMVDSSDSGNVRPTTRGVTNKDSGSSAKSKVSVVSKQRITVKKMEKSSGHSVDSKTEEMNEDIEMDEKQLDKSVTNEEDNDEDSDFEENDDSDDDCMDDDEEEEEDEDNEETNPALDVLFVDGIESMEPVKVENGYACSLCSAKFPTERLCTRHGEQNFCYERCEMCGKLFKKKDAEILKQHISKHKTTQKFSCSKCIKIFFEKDQLQVHSRKHTQANVAKCSHCKEEFKTWFLYSSHMLRVHDEHNMFTCDVCNAKFVNISFLKSEVLFDGELSFFKCVMCSN